MKALHLTRLHELDFGTPVADVAFVDDGRVVFSTPGGDVRTGGVGAGRQPSEPLVAWRDFGVGEPGLGAFVYLAVSPRRDLLALNPTDLAVATLPLDGSRPLRMEHAELRDCNPVLRFSPGGAYLSVETPDVLLLLDLRAHRTRDLGEEAVSAWHPSEDRLLVLDREKRLAWIDAATRRSTALGAIDLPGNVCGMMPREDGAECVFACRDDTLRWWAIDPLRALQTRPAGGEVVGLVPSPDRRLMAVMREDGCRLWDAAARAPVGNPLHGVESVAFAPSGRRLVACVDPDLENPGNKRTPSLWEITES